MLVSCDKSDNWDRSIPKILGLPRSTNRNTGRNAINEIREYRLVGATGGSFAILHNAATGTAHDDDRDHDDDNDNDDNGPVGRGRGGRESRRSGEKESNDSCRTLWGSFETVRPRAAREKEREGPWEERAICIPNDRMTFARCIKMPLIGGVRENTFGMARRRAR